MKILPSITLSLIFLVFWSCSDSGEPKLEGCTDSGACNYSAENTHNDGSCWSASDGCECADGEGSEVDECGVCGGSGVDATTACCANTGAGLNDEVADCAGVCGGDAVDDACGTCEGSITDATQCNISYSETIQPIFTANCSGCHISSTRNNLSLSNYSSITSGNSSNGPVILAGDHANSLLWQKVNSGLMPPSGQLTTDQINLIATWIDEGARDN